MNPNLTNDNIRELASIVRFLRTKLSTGLQTDDERLLRQYFSQLPPTAATDEQLFGLNPLLLAFQTTQIIVEEIGLRRDAVVAVLLRPCVDAGVTDIETVRETFGETPARILHSLERISGLYDKTPAVESENFRNLLLSFAEDMQVILIMIADRVNLMRQIRDTPFRDRQRQVSLEASYLYAPLAHKLGLYKLKSELEDLSLKYLEHDAYYMIREKLNATKKARDAYIDAFIRPVSERLSEAGLKFHVKGRTKSIHSIWQKMKKQKCGFEGIYDLFAIRIILDSDEKREKMECWQAYSIVTDMYQPNPKRLRDWLSVPKSNGYESLHITVLGPEQKWVEVQIRTERMDAVAERGVAAHWRYKGIKSEGGLDSWLAGIRTILETADGTAAMDQFKMDLYEDEVFVFTPKGDLMKFPKGATVLDFAYHIHSNIGNHCTGAHINNKVVTLRQELHSGDQVDVITSASQKPKREWLDILKTSRAKSKVRLALKETTVKEGLMAKELLERRFRNRKIDMEEPLMAKLIKKLGFKEVHDFYKQIAEGELDTLAVIEKYVELRDQQSGKTPNAGPQSAGQYSLTPDKSDTASATGSDELVIDRNLKDVEYSLAKCCSPIYGDNIFGFVTSMGGIKIHRTDCPNAPELYRRFGYRVVRARWSGKGASKYSITIRVVGNDDIGIVNNLTSIISKDERLTLRSVSIDSHDGLFSGNLVVMLEDTSRLAQLLKRLSAVKGVKHVERI